MSILKSIAKPVKGAYKEYKRRVNRPYMPCDFSEGISRDDLREFADIAIKSIKGKKIEVSVKDAVVKL